VQSNHSEVTCV